MPKRSLPNGEINNKGHKNVKSDKKYATEPNLLTAREQNKKAGHCLAPLQLSVSGGWLKVVAAVHTSVDDQKGLILTDFEVTKRF